MKSKAPQLHLEYRFYKLLGQTGRLMPADCLFVGVDMRRWGTKSVRAKGQLRGDDDDAEVEGA